MAFRVLSQVLFIFVALSSRVAFSDEGQLNQIGSQSGEVPTSPAATPSPGVKNWRDQTEATCGISCRYRRANDNLTFQALFLITKISKIEDAISKDKDEDAMKALGSFCTSASEDVHECFSRYKDFQRVALLQIRQSIGKNEDTIAHLTSGRKADGTVEGDAVSFAPNADRSVYLPEVPTVSELETAYLNGKLKPRTGAHSGEDIKKWSQELVGIAPKNQRYLEFNKKPVDANPYQGQPSKNKIHMLVRDGNGMPLADKTVEAEIQKSQKSIREIAEGKIVLGKDVKVITPKELSKDDKVSYEALTEARSILNDRISADIEKEGGLRAPAAAAKAQVAKDGKNTGSERGIKSTTDSSSLEKKSSSEQKSAKGLPEKDDGKVDGVAEETASQRTKADQSRDLTLQNTSARTPSSYKKYGDEERVKMPEQIQNSRYIRYDLGNLFDEIKDSTSK